MAQAARACPHERLGGVLRRHHLWVEKGGRLQAETSDLVDRTPAFVRSLLAESGLKLVERRFLDLNYPRHFWVAQRAT